MITQNIKPTTAAPYHRIIVILLFAVVVPVDIIPDVVLVVAIADLFIKMARTPRTTTAANNNNNNNN